jgi:hypothetical protein
MAKTRRAYTGGAASTTTSAAIASSGTTSFTITAYTGWPYGADPFSVVVEPGTANEEKMLVVRSGSTDTTVSVYSTPSVAANRGIDGTSAVAHSSGATIYPVFTALDADEANEMASTLTTKGDLFAHNASTFTRLAVGTDDYALVADSGEATGIKWSQLATASLADSAVTSAKLASTIDGKTFTDSKFTSARDTWQISATAATGTVNVDVETGTAWYYTSNASANWTFNFRGDASTTLDSILTAGDSVTVVFLVTNGATAYYPTVFQVDGSAVTPKWAADDAPAAGNASSVDSYLFTVIKTGAATFSVFGQQVQFA